MGLESYHKILSTVFSKIGVTRQLSIGCTTHTCYSKFTKSVNITRFVNPNRLAIDCEIFHKYSPALFSHLASNPLLSSQFQQKLPSKVSNFKI